MWLFVACVIDFLRFYCYNLINNKLEFIILTLRSFFAYTKKIPKKCIKLRTANRNMSNILKFEFSLEAFLGI